jgi:hypothetical protein
LGALIGVSQVAIHRWERGVIGPTPEHEHSLAIFFAQNKQANFASDAGLVEALENLPVRTLAFTKDGEVVATSAPERAHWKMAGYDEQDVRSAVQEINSVDQQLDRLIERLSAANTYAKIAGKSFTFPHYWGCGTMFTLRFKNDNIVIFLFTNWEPILEDNPPILKLLAYGSEFVAKAQKVWQPSSLYEFIDEHDDPIYLYDWDQRKITMLSAGWRKAGYKLEFAR